MEGGGNWRVEELVSFHTAVVIGFRDGRGGGSGVTAFHIIGGLGAQAAQASGLRLQRDDWTGLCDGCYVPPLELHCIFGLLCL